LSSSRANGLVVQIAAKKTQLIVSTPVAAVLGFERE
jgi:hypothetical protein